MIEDQKLARKIKVPERLLHAQRYAMPESLEARLHAEPFDRKDGRKRKLDDHKHDNACASVCRLSFEADRYACGGQETRTEIISVTLVTGCHLHPHRGVPE